MKNLNELSIVQKFDISIQWILYGLQNVKSSVKGLSLKLGRCYFYVISTVSMLLVIIKYDYCHIALYKMNCIVLLFL